MADFDVQQVVEAAARAMWEAIGIDAPTSLDREGFSIEARAALAVIVPAVTEQVRAEVCGEDSEEWVRNAGGACMVSGASVLDALDELDAAARADS